ncbi:MAG: hypothetical protein NC080_07340 [Paraprevotella sp.]|nr:hypothetical protein [Paraprevotella sp.]
MIEVITYGVIGAVRCNVYLAKPQDFEKVRYFFSLSDSDAVDWDSDVAVQTFFNGEDFITVIWMKNELSGSELDTQLKLAGASAYNYIKEKGRMDDTPRQAFCEHFATVVADNYGLDVSCGNLN